MRPPMSVYLAYQPFRIACDTSCSVTLYLLNGNTLAQQLRIESDDATQAKFCVGSACKALGDVVSWILAPPSAE